MGLLNSFLVVQSRTRALYYVSDTFRAHCARVFLVIIPAPRAVFRPIFVHRVPTETLEMRTLTRSWTLRSSTEVICCHESRNPIFCGWKWSDWVSDETSCDRIGLHVELSSVDPKVFVIQLYGYCPIKDFLFSNRYSCMHTWIYRYIYVYIMQKLC